MDKFWDRGAMSYGLKSKDLVKHLEEKGLVLKALEPVILLF
jgi:hypothetical protein